VNRSKFNRQEVEVLEDKNLAENNKDVKVKLNNIDYDGKAKQTIKMAGCQKAKQEKPEITGTNDLTTKAALSGSRIQSPGKALNLTHNY
jgi:hypothetical protein